MNLLIIVGTRPNFIKITQFPKLIAGTKGIKLNIIHTGQHHSHNMSSIFFRQFGFEPDSYLDLETQTPTANIGEIMIGLEKYIEKIKPDMIMVVGDVNSTLAGAIVANKLGIRLAHLESGLRSGDRTMPEEINRILTDEISDDFFVTEQSGIDNLIKEGKRKERIYLVGNTMIDTLVAFQDQIQDNNISKKFNLIDGYYGLITMHRPATVDYHEGLKKLIFILKNIGEKTPVIFPIHPRTLKNLKNFRLYEEFEKIKNLRTCEPLDYFAFQHLISHSKFVITDSGGIQEETTFYGIPCITLRPNTERPSTVDLGTNTLINFDPDKVSGKVIAIEEGKYKRGKLPPFWDGNATKRIIGILTK